MKNTHLIQRLGGIQGHLWSAYQAGIPLANSSKGFERELFLSQFLSLVIPSPYRFGSGVVTDLKNSISGQVDIVIENPFLPSLPVFEHGPRLYLAEGVVTALEVKSDLAGQWDQILETCSKLKTIVREFSGPGMFNGELPINVPLFAVGYKGWSKPETVIEHLESSAVDGVFIVNPCLFVSRGKELGVDRPWVALEGPEATWALISCINTAATSIAFHHMSPLVYIND